ncbi:uncharacterized protein BKA78DRAFT_293324 [Phyllosticta capitalensis]|uniref:uncharacterized protein n=1 Tax=Phyllosticta capitalensis TaxID=121624 RepID=UPI00312FFF88
MQFKVALVSLFAALAIASPLEKRCTANGGSCTQLSQCCSGNCEYDSSIGLVCKAASKKREAEPELEKRCSANGVTCNFNNAECCSGNCEYSIGDSNAYCRATSKKREAEPIPEALLEKRCTANGGKSSKLQRPGTELTQSGTCNFNNAECCSGNCLYSLGDSNAYCAATSKKREAEPAAEPELEKRCTANGGSCTQLSQCCSGNCEYDSSIGLVCKA